MVTSGEVLAARRLLGWSRARLAEQLGTTVRVINQFEDSQSGGERFDTEKAQALFELAGIEFYNEHNARTVRLKRKSLASPRSS